MAGQPEDFGEIVQHEREAQLRWEQEQTRLAAAPPPAPVPVQLSPEEQHINQLNGVLWSDGILVARAALRAKVHQDWVNKKPALGGFIDRKVGMGWYLDFGAHGENDSEGYSATYWGLVLNHLGQLCRIRERISSGRTFWDPERANDREWILWILNDKRVRPAEVRVKTDEALAEYRRDLARFVIRHGLDLGDHRIY